MAAPQSKLIGAWKLISFALYPADAPDSKPVQSPLGESPVGRILFTPDGYMNVTLTSADALAPIDAKQWIYAEEKDIIRVARMMQTYCGPYYAYEEDGAQMLRTDIELSIDPNMIGTPSIRKWNFLEGSQDSVLVLRPAQEYVLQVSFMNPYNHILGSQASHIRTVPK